MAGQTRHCTGEIPARVSLRRTEEWDRQTRKKPAVPCHVTEIAGRKCGFAGQPERQGHGSAPHRRGDAIAEGNFKAEDALAEPKAEPRGVPIAPSHSEPGEGEPRRHSKSAGEA